MNKSKFLILFRLCLLMLHTCYASHVDTVLSKEIFITVEEKKELFQALGIEYIHEVIMSPELHDYITKLSATPTAQNVFAHHEFYQQCAVQNLRRHLDGIHNRSITDSMIIKKINPIVGYGVIAGQKIKAGTIMGLYAGEIILSSQTRSDYSFACSSIIPDCSRFDLDAQFKGNELRFINGSQDRANCEGCSFLIETGESRIVYQATQDIEEKEDILADYGDAYWVTHRKNQYQELGVSQK